MISYIKAKLGIKKKHKSYIKSELLSNDSPFIITEAYKALRTNLVFMLHDKKKMVAFTSTMASEGKTTTCLNVAIAFAQIGKKTLVIDLDMRKPRAHRYFDVPSTPGISDYLGGFEKEIPVKKTKYENLYVLPVGTIPPAPPELLMSPVVDDLFAKLREEYDYVFIDTPPVHLVTDAAIIASKIDGIVFVVRENGVAFDIVKEAVAGLENVGAKVLGFILNDSTGASPMSKYKYRYKSYYKSRYGLRYGYAYGYGFSKIDNKE